MKNEKNYMPFIGGLVIGGVVWAVLSGGCSSVRGGGGTPSPTEAIRGAERKQRQTEVYIDKARRGVSECQAILDDSERRIKECERILNCIRERTTPKTADGKVED